MNKMETQFRIYWNPQVGSDIPFFYRNVDSPKAAKVLLDTLADYDLYQLKNKIKPDFSNMGGLEVFEDGEWSDWVNEDGYSIDELELDQL